MAGQQINIQNKIIRGIGNKPTIPIPHTILPDDSRWKNSTDILIAQWALNIDDNVWYYRTKDNIIVDFGQGNIPSFTWGQGIGNIEDQTDLIEYIESHGGAMTGPEILTAIGDGNITEPYLSQDLIDRINF